MSTRSSSRIAAGLLAGALALIASGCASSPRTETVSGPVATINSVCPIGADPFDNSSVEPALVRVHRGQKIGFCCESCPARFDKMAEADRDRILALAKENKAE